MSNPNRPLVALRPLASLPFKVWYVFYANRKVPFPKYEDAQDWANWLASEHGSAKRREARDG
jgi:hypothetical protein